MDRRARRQALNEQELMGDSTNIAGKVVVITGASSGLGEATARYLADRGAIVVWALGALIASRHWSMRSPDGAARPHRG